MYGLYFYIDYSNKCMDFTFTLIYQFINEIVWRNFFINSQHVSISNCLSIKASNRQTIFEWFETVVNMRYIVCMSPDLFLLQGLLVEYFFYPKIEWHFRNLKTK